ncbi:1547_t:CDS:2 [Acaulospora morrowiae]|uniref:1547_t:CDS:1 n=1 Tax=Acaulospora morrowiae TaxID=94023 RepID=A0A9N8ZRM7_9GLOM|nr:1547_t:CDS:2 [Acaulospora morrowiae]
MKPIHLVLFHKDILPAIISSFEYQDDIFRCLLVHSTWTGIVIKVLWKAPTWSSYRAYQKFLGSVAAPTARYPYGTFVESLKFSSSAFQYNIQSLDLITNRCPNIQHLTFDCMKSPNNFPPEVLATLLLRFPNLVSLKGPNTASIHWITTTLEPIRKGNCRHLRSLTLPWDWRDPLLEMLLQDIGSHCLQITSLNINTDVYDQIAKIIARSFPNIKIFSCLAVTHKSLGIILHGCRYLRSLKLQFSQDFNDGEALAIADSFPLLNSFVLTRFWTSLPKFFKTWALNQRYLRHIEFSDCSSLTQEMFQPIVQSCISLESVKLGHCHQITDSSITFLARHRGRYLKRLSLHHNNGVSDMGINSIAEHCKNLRILNLFECPRVTTSAIINIITQCRLLMELSGSYSVVMTDPIIKCLIINGSPKLEVLGNKFFALNNSRVLKTINSKLLSKLGNQMSTLRVLEIRYPIKGVNPNKLMKSILRFPQLEKLCIVPPPRLKRKHIRILESHPRLKEVRFLAHNNAKVLQYIHDRERQDRAGVRISIGIIDSEEEM